MSCKECHGGERECDCYRVSLRCRIHWAVGRSRLHRLRCWKGVSLFHTLHDFSFIHSPLHRGARRRRALAQSCRAPTDWTVDLRPSTDSIGESPSLIYTLHVMVKPSGRAAAVRSAAAHPYDRVAKGAVGSKLPLNGGWVRTLPYPTQRGGPVRPKKSEKAKKS